MTMRTAALYYRDPRALTTAAEMLALRGVHPDVEGAETALVAVMLRGIALFLSLAIPLAFIAYVDHVRKTVGFNWLGALGALGAISAVLAMGVVANRG